MNKNYTLYLNTKDTDKVKKKIKGYKSLSQLVRELLREWLRRENK